MAEDEQKKELMMVLERDGKHRSQSRERIQVKSFLKKKSSWSGRHSTNSDGSKNENSNVNMVDVKGND